MPGERALLLRTQSTITHQYLSDDSFSSRITGWP
jgi:hypothetical protein